MAVNVIEIAAVYTTLHDAIVAKYDTMWSDNEIDAETYASLVGQASSQMMQLAADLVQNQESLDADVAIKEVQLVITDTEAAIKEQEEANMIKQGELLDEQVKLTYAERIIKDKEAAKMGLDDAMGIAEDARTGTTVYSPQYEDV